MYNYTANSKYIGKQFLYLTTCHSTNDVAKTLSAQQLSKNGMVIITDNQTRGRGQQGNTWLSDPHQNLTFSIVLKPQKLNIAQQFLFNKTLSIHLLGFFRTYFPETASAFKIKWPNDLYFNNKKIAGILIENALQGSDIQTSIVGIGINVNQTKFDLPSASSLSLELKTEIDRTALFNQLLSYLDEHLPPIFYNSEAEIRTIENIYDQILWGINEKKEFKTNEGTFGGTIKGVDTQGLLILEVEDQLKKFEIKSIQFINTHNN